MSPRNTIRDWARLLYYLSQNAISLIGVVLTTSSAVTLIAFWIYDFMLPGPPHPYVGTYSRPIPSPVRYLRPASETCEQCHWPQRFSGDKFIVKTSYKDDEKNMTLTTALVMKIGGRASSGSVGIHGRYLDDASSLILACSENLKTWITV
jgi:hypothetical protein